MTKDLKSFKLREGWCEECQDYCYADNFKGESKRIGELCPKCQETHLVYVVDTPHKINPLLDDNTNIIEVWKCPECAYYESF